MGLFDQLGQQLSRQNLQNPQQAQQAFQSDLATLKANPIEYARAHGKTIPQGITDPGQMVQYLLKSAQVNNPRYQAAMQLLGGLSVKR